MSERDAVGGTITKIKRGTPEIKALITNEQDQHGTQSTHYEARGIDITVSDKDGTRLGRLGRLEVNAGFDWSFTKASFTFMSQCR